MLRNVAFEDNIPIELNIVHKNKSTVKLIGTVNIENDIPEPSFLVDIIDYELKNEISETDIPKDSKNWFSKAKFKNRALFYKVYFTVLHVITPGMIGIPIMEDIIGIE